MPTVTTNSLSGGWKLPVGCSISGASPNVQITFFTPSPTAKQLATGVGAVGASPFGTNNVSLTPAMIAALLAALSAYSPNAVAQAPASYAFWAAYGLFVAAGGS